MPEPQIPPVPPFPPSASELMLSIHADPAVPGLSDRVARERNTVLAPLQAAFEREGSEQERQQIDYLTAQIRKDRNSYSVLCAISGVWLGMGVIMVLSGAALGILPWEALPIFAGYTGVGLLAFVPEVLRRHRLNRYVETLLTFDNKRMVGVLTELLPLRASRWARQAKRKLGELLFRLEATDRLLDHHHCRLLTQALPFETDAFFLLASLHALEIAGTIPSLPHINSLVNGAGLARHYAEVRNAAIACREAIRQQMTDKRCVSLLLDYMSRQAEYTEFWPEVRRGLVHLLPQLTSADRYLIKKHHIQRLQDALQSYDMELILAILCACRQVGLVEALPAVARLAAGVGTRSRGDVEVRALRCYEVLQRLKESAQSAQVLLRAAAAPEVRSEELVRPVVSYATDPDELLRATITQQER